MSPEDIALDSGSQPLESDPQITLALAGDVMLGRLMNRMVEAMGARYPWGNVLALLRGADLAIVNLECVIAADGEPWRRTPKVFHFRANPIAIDVLRVAGIDAVSLANNHVLDYEEAALIEMLDHLDRAEIAHAGAGRDLASAIRAAHLTARGIRVALVSFTDNEPGWAATAETPGINYIPIGPDQACRTYLERQIAAARVAADVVICSAHWGPNMRLRPSPPFREFAHAALDAGADLFVGHSAHVFQGIELYGGKPIIYDLGDFVDDYAVDATLRNDQSLLYMVTVARDGVRSVEAIPVLIDRCQVNLAEEPAFGQIATRLSNLSAEFGTTVQVVDRRLHLVGQMQAQAANS